MAPHDPAPPPKATEEEAVRLQPSRTESSPDRYRLQWQLGKKAGRQTWLAEDLQTGETVVVKRLTFGTDVEWDDLRLFEREAETLRSLDHPAIPRYLDFFEFSDASGKGFGLVQSYIEARSLEEHLKAGRRFSEAEITQLAKDLLEILAYLHRHQPPVIHRDIKPSNILLTDRSGNSAGQVYLVDFGSVQTLAAQEGGTITIVGTYGYMPPEQFGGRAVPASDLYSLGATLIYLATGQHPADLPQVDLKLQFEPIANLSPALIHWLQRLVEPSLTKRYDSVEAALKGFENPALPEETRTIASPNPANGIKIDFSSDRKTLMVSLPPRRLGFFQTWGLYTLFAIGIVLMLVTILALAGALVIIFAWVFTSRSSALTHVPVESLLGSVGFTFLGTIGWFLTQPLMKQQSLSSRCVYLNRWGNPVIEFCPGKSIVFRSTTRGVRRFDLSQYNISDAELDWLAHEISQWAEVPITYV